jgi:ubiquinone/menaquinone biosynthesis C-methylase UbiE
MVFSRSQPYYDEIYSFKDYAKEDEALYRLIEETKACPEESLLEVACGTGTHLTNLKAHYRVEGLDIDPAMLDLARAKQPDIPFHLGDMERFDLGKQFGAVVCLFGSIGALKTQEDLDLAAGAMARHLLPGGVLVVEPWLMPDDYEVGRLTVQTVDKPQLKIARVSLSGLEGQTALIDFHYVVGEPGRVHHFTERLALTLFRLQDYRQAFSEAGLMFSQVTAGPWPRGLLVGTMPRT